MNSASASSRKLPPGVSAQRLFTLRPPARAGVVLPAPGAGVPRPQTLIRHTRLRIAMVTMETKSGDGLHAQDSFIQWATSGMPSSLGHSARSALQAIAMTGECIGGNEDWVLFGEVTDVVARDPLHVQVRQTSMLMNDDRLDDVWARFDIVCPVNHSRVDLTPGMWIGIFVRPTQRSVVGRIYADSSAPLWNLSQHNGDLAWNVAHLFAGAYEGWLRAMWWLQQGNFGYSFATHTSVDWCPDVMRTWSFNHGRPAAQVPIPVDFNPMEAFIGIQADIGDISLLRATARKSNLLMTLSPPRPSWSRGGKSSGLATDEGFCFIDAILHVARVRPIMALFECSDGIESHQHWRAISAALRLAGYRKIWSQDVAIHQLTGNCRTRWLAVWARQDIESAKIDERFLCAAARRLPWDDSRHMFTIPRSRQSELLLQPEQLQVYGDRGLLPPGKRAKVSENATSEQILEQRLLQQGEYLPTLCASYTAQHLLNREHLEAKGIFATLIRQNGDIRFIDPFVFVVLFGATDSLALPSVLRKAFHQLGNGISQLHALIAILFALEGVSGESHPKLALVQQCWEDRLTVDKAMVRQCDDMYVLQPLADFISKAIPSIVTWQPWLAGHSMIRFCDDMTLIPQNILESGKVTQKLLESLDLAEHHESLLRIQSDGRDLPGDLSWNRLPSGDVTVKIGIHTLCTIHVIRTDERAREYDPITSPTQPWCQEEDDPEFEQIQDAYRAGFFHVAEYVCQDHAPQQTGKILLLQQDGSFEWIRNANLDRLGSIPSFRDSDTSLFFIKVNRDACVRLLGVHAILAIRGTYDPVSQDKWVLLAGGQGLRRCKICQVPRTTTPRACNELLGQQCHITMRNLVECREDQPLMLINGDVLWSDTRVTDVVSIAFGRMDRLSDQPSCNVRNDQLGARLLQFNLEPGSLAVDEVVFHFDILQTLMPSICWCHPAQWVTNEAQFRFPNEPVDLQMCYHHFVVPIPVVFDWIFVEVRFFEGQWRTLYHSPEQLTIRQTTAVCLSTPWVFRSHPLHTGGLEHLKTQSLPPGILSVPSTLVRVHLCCQQHTVAHRDYKERTAPRV